MSRRELGFFLALFLVLLIVLLNDFSSPVGLSRTINLVPPPINLVPPLCHLGVFIAIVIGWHDWGDSTLGRFTKQHALRWFVVWNAVAVALVLIAANAHP
jgi:Na+/H+-dicarboxylate symporter